MSNTKQQNGNENSEMKDTAIMIRRANKYIIHEHNPSQIS